MHEDRLHSIARALVAPHKGLLAADESTNNIKKHFDDIGVVSTPETRRAYRELLFTAPDIEHYISGVILYDETIRQKTADGVLFPKYLERLGIIPGIKVDTGTKPLNTWSHELVTSGIEGLPERLEDYYALGARFAKWRAVIMIGDALPSHDCLATNTDLLARYARMCQERGIVPIVEPEVLMNGPHSMAACFDTTVATHKMLFTALREHQVYLPGLILKSNMVVPGDTSGEVVTAEHIAKETVHALRMNVPMDVPGVVFLSGGMSEVEATKNLNAMNQMYTDLPWRLTYSYGRALQASALEAWRGRKANVIVAQQAFLNRAMLNSLASAGEYEGE